VSRPDPKPTAVPDAAGDDERGMSGADVLRARLAWASEQPVDARQAAARQVGELVREVIDRLTATSAPAPVLEDVAAKVQDALTLLEAYPPNRRYEGYPEASGAAHGRGYFDWSPILGIANPLAPPIRMAIEDELVVGRARFGSAYEGPPGCVHGGWVAAAFDDFLGLVQTVSGHVGMTGTLTVRYRRPTPLHTDVRFEGALDRVRGRTVVVSGSLFAEGELTAEATCVFVTVSPERFAALTGNRPS
jgi:acyl-coenzyme A thioesterase PaaI-like protein